MSLVVDSKRGEVCWDGSRVFWRFLGGIGGWNFRRIGGWYVGPAGRCFVRLLGGGVAWRGRRISGWHLRYFLGTCCCIRSELPEDLSLIEMLVKHSMFNPM